MKVAAVVVAAALVGPAVASASDPPIGGFLSVEEAIQFQKQYFPPEAPRLLRDRRATFFHTKRPIWVGRCHSVNRPTVTCRFSLKLLPDKAHRKKNWFPIRCRGRVRARHRTESPRSAVVLRTTSERSRRMMSSGSLTSAIAEV